MNNKILLIEAIEYLYETGQMKESVKKKLLQIIKPM